MLAEWPREVSPPGSYFIRTVFQSPRLANYHRWGELTIGPSGDVRRRRGSSLAPPTPPARCRRSDHCPVQSLPLLHAAGLRPQCRFSRFTAHAHWFGYLATPMIGSSGGMHTASPCVSLALVDHEHFKNMPQISRCLPPRFAPFGGGRTSPPCIF